jgi:surface antigen
MRKTILVLAASVPLLGACQTNEQTGGLLGGLGGAAGGALIGGAISHNATGALLGGAIGGLGGYLVGSAIGRSLDERDRRLANQAVMQALYAPPGPGYYGPEPYYEPAPGAPPPHRHHRYPRRSAHWTSDHSGAHGSVTVVAVQQTAGGAECKTVREVAYVSGRELAENQRYCRSGSSEWQKA